MSFIEFCDLILLFILIGIWIIEFNYYRYLKQEQMEDENEVHAERDAREIEEWYF